MILRLKFTIFTICVISRMITVDAKINVYDQDKENVASFKDKEADIGEILIQSIQGYIEVADPQDACIKIAKPTILSNFSIGKFVLINGTEKCSYMLKVKNAERAGFDIAVVYDPFPKPYHNNHTVPFPEPQMKIPLIFISYKDGIEIRDRYKYNRKFVNNYVLEIVPNTYHIGQKIIILFAAIAVVVFAILLIIIVILIKCILRRRRILKECFSNGPKYETCAICLEDYNQGEGLVKLTCGHVYHPHCIDPWFSDGNRTCPLCIRKVCYNKSIQYGERPSAEGTPLLF